MLGLCYKSNQGKVNSVEVCFPLMDNDKNFCWKYFVYLSKSVCILKLFWRAKDKRNISTSPSRIVYCNLADLILQPEVILIKQPSPIFSTSCEGSPVSCSINTTGTPTHFQKLHFSHNYIFQSLAFHCVSFCDTLFVNICKLDVYICCQHLGNTCHLIYILL